MKTSIWTQIVPFSPSCQLPGTLYYRPSCPLSADYDWLASLPGGPESRESTVDNLFRVELWPADTGDSPGLRSTRVAGFRPRGQVVPRYRREVEPGRKLQRVSSAAPEGVRPVCQEGACHR